MDILGGHLLEDRTARTRQGLGPYSQQTKPKDMGLGPGPIKPGAPPSGPSAPSPGLSAPPPPPMAPAMGGRNQRRGLGDQVGPGIMKAKPAPGPSRPSPGSQVPARPSRPFPGSPSHAQPRSSSPWFSDLDFLDSTGGHEQAFD